MTEQQLRHERRMLCQAIYGRDDDECQADLPGDVALLLEERRIAMQIVAKIPRTADNVAIVPGMALWEGTKSDPFHVSELIPFSNDTKRSEWMCDGEIDPAQCYSTRAAAEAAAKSP